MPARRHTISAMRSDAKPGDAGTRSTPPRKGSLRIALVVGAALVALVVIAGFELGAFRGPAHEDAAPSRERAPSPTAQAAAQRPAPRPALPQAQPQANPVEPPAERPSLGAITGEDKRTRTHIKVDRYVHEAYPAWREAHPGQECPKQLSELNEYIHESDAKDGWGRPLRMYCGAARWAGKKRIEVISPGRDAQIRTEDDIIAEE